MGHEGEEGEDCHVQVRMDDKLKKAAVTTLMMI
jgi:hypothetical protein